MSSVLYPALAVIEAGLRGDDQAAAGDAREDAGPVLDDAALVMPPFLRELVERKVASQRAFPPAPPAVGQIRALAAIPHADGSSRALGRAYACLLGASLGGGRWSGWLVAQESDYAGERDLLCEQSDGPIAPEAAMVQAWNQLECVIRGDEPILGVLAPPRLAAVRQLGEMAAAGTQFVAPRPGRIGAWNLDADTVVVTGTPLGEADDPRHRYQQLYRELAVELTAAAAPRAAVPSAAVRRSWLAWLQETLVRPAWTFGALALVLLQAGLLLTLTIPAGDDGTAYRGAGMVKRDPCAPAIRAVFRPETSYADVVITLRRVEGGLVDGPSETGEVWLTLPTDQKAQEAANILKQSEWVEVADVVPARGKCAR